jgi:hypothetical protein
VLVEGQTEETFVKKILVPEFWQRGLHFTPVILKTKRVPGRGHFRGGILPYSKVTADVRRLLNDRSAVCITTMLDLYGLPEDFPGNVQGERGVNKALVLERAFGDDVGDPRFLPYLQVHEFEALLFSDPIKFGVAFPPHVPNRVSAVAQDFASPEDINETPDGAPSKRIASIVGSSHYQKPFHGSLIASEISLGTIRSKCPHFDHWMTQLEHL